MEEETFSHFLHEHPLSRIPYSAQKSHYSTYCYGCRRYFLHGDTTYGCSRSCGFPRLLHKECMEMPAEIMHPIHPSHPLTLQHSYGSGECAVCERRVQGLGYVSDALWIHMACAAVVKYKDEKPPPPPKDHPSHPQHELRFSNKTRWCPFPCDVCGTIEKGDSYICILCNYWIHESCALLPASAHFPLHHPDHSLSLAFSPPSEYVAYDFDCAICSTTLPLRRWVYHCHLCSYVIHVKCATNASSST